MADVGSGGGPARATREIWLVEDHRELRDQLAELIDGEDDLRCTLAVGSCEEFLEAAEQGGAPDVVLMDLGLPGRSGVDGIRRMHTLSPATRIVVLTIHAEDEKVFDAVCAGAAGYLLKPSTPAELLDALREVQRGAAPVNPYIARKMLSLFSRLAAPAPAADDPGLTGREREILQLLVDGLSSRQIGERLGIAYYTVCNHLRNVYAKLHVRSRSGAVARALRDELV